MIRQRHRTTAGIFFAGDLASTLVAFFGAVSVWFYFLARRSKSVARAIVCGLFLGIAFNYHVNGFAIAASIGLLLLGEFGSMPEQGVVDPVKVTRSAVQNAVSIAGLLLTTEALITDIPETNSGGGGGMPGGGMGGMDF